MSNPPRFVVLQFDDGDRFDYEPPLPHPADIFLARFAENRWFGAEVGATLAREMDEEGKIIDPIVVIYPAEPPSFP